MGLLESLGVELPLGIVGLGAELEPKICSGQQLRLVGIHATSCLEFLHLWISGSRNSLVLGLMLWPSHL